MIKKTLFILLISYSLFPQKQTWATTRFEKFWFSQINKMQFREPFTLMPFNFKFGYYSYGGKNYFKHWQKVLYGHEGKITNPIIFKSSNTYFDEILYRNNRKMLVAEIDLMKYNFFKKKQNIVDVQLGVGYKFIKSLSGITDTDVDGFPIFFKPKIHEFNLNATFYIQFNPRRYYSLFYSAGYAKGDIYESILGVADGDGINQSFGIAFNFIRPRVNKNNMSHYGIEIRFDKIRINLPSDPLDIISSFSADQIGINYSFGIGYGGTQTLGDEAYYDMIDNDFINAKPKFQSFKLTNKVEGRVDEIDKMIKFCQKQLPYQMYEKANSEYNKGYLEAAIWWLNKAIPTSDDYLKEKIRKMKITIISDLLKNYNDNQTINEQVSILKELQSYDPNNLELNEKLSSLLIKKADYNLNQEKYFDAYALYKEALNLNPYMSSVIKLRFQNYITKIINSAYIYLQNNDNVIAYELLSLISEFSDKKNISEALLNISADKLNEKEIINTRARIQNILYNNQVTHLGLSDLRLGNSYLNIVELLGDPIEQIFKEHLDNSYQLAIFNIHDNKYKLFFKNHILIDLERAK